MMRIDQALLYSIVLLSPFTSIDAFVFRSALVSSSSKVSSATGPLKVGAAMDWNEQDLDEAFLMQRAEACANSDSCSLDDVRISLDDVLHVQSGCVTGTVLGSVCENVDTAAKIVANLRQKIEQKSREAIVVNASVNVAAISLTMVALAGFVSGMAAVHVDSTPFTVQEWFWAFRDGYLPQMLTHYFRNGGLVSCDYDPETTPFAMQEWWWALKGGYLNTMTEHYFRNGGLATAENFEPDVVPFTPSEWLHAVKGGYLDRLVHHNFQHGGLATTESSADMEAVALTPQELYWAARDGYLRQFSEHMFRNGGV